MPTTRCPTMTIHLLWLALLAMLVRTAPAQHRLALVGGTVIDVADRGRSSQDLTDAFGGVIYSGTSDIQRNLIARLL